MPVREAGKRNWRVLLKWSFKIAIEDKLIHLSLQEGLL